MEGALCHEIRKFGWFSIEYFRGREFWVVASQLDAFGDMVRGFRISIDRGFIVRRVCWFWGFFWQERHVGPSIFEGFSNPINKVVEVVVRWGVLNAIG